FRVHNPATGALLAEVPETSRDALASMVVRARAAQSGWAALPFRDRARALKRLVRRMRDDPELLDTLTAESGKPRYEAELFELFYTLELTRYYTSRHGKRALVDQVRRQFLFPNKRARIIQHPRGVVSVIGPWNWPLLNNFADAIAPLLAGNAVILKPSEWTPLTSLRIEKLWRAEGLPEALFQVAIGASEVGRALVDSADMVFFTGSERAGREIAKAAAERMVPVILELGGKSAMIVLADADLPRAARAAIWSGFAHSGQVCIRTERVFVEEAIADRFNAACVAELKKLRQGPSADPDVFDIGAMTFPPQMDRLDQQIADALTRGAKLLHGGARAKDRIGNYFTPTLLADATTEMRVMTEETFGPVLPIMRVKSAEHALRLTNESRLGLSGSIWSRDSARANALARRIESGSVCVNDVLFNYLAVEAPLGGIKHSGLGVRHGAEALRQFCWTESVLEDAPLLGRFSDLVARLLGFPYDRRTLAIARWAMKRLY
ncbi:MAG TPA: aldehyde dehydrogenase family protein, partial [Polyangiales bacterium]|nr:aldehyde dehydrogenase family protein [Polyangiales bacterium]